MFTEVEESGQMGLRLDGNNSTDTNLDVVVHRLVSYTVVQVV